jgi:hypothetical protein
MDEFSPDAKDRDITECIWENDRILKQNKWNNDFFDHQLWSHYHDCFIECLSNVIIELQHYLADDWIIYLYSIQQRLDYCWYEENYLNGLPANNRTAFITNSLATIIDHDETLILLIMNGDDRKHVHVINEKNTIDVMTLITDEILTCERLSLQYNPGDACVEYYQTKISDLVKYSRTLMSIY